MENKKGYYRIPLLKRQFRIAFMKKLDSEESQQKICPFVTSTQTEILIYMY